MGRYTPVLLVLYSGASVAYQVFQEGRSGFYLGSHPRVQEVWLDWKYTSGYLWQLPMVSKYQLPRATNCSYQWLSNIRYQGLPNVSCQQLPNVKCQGLTDVRYQGLPNVSTKGYQMCGTWQLCRFTPEKFANQKP